MYSDKSFSKYILYFLLVTATEFLGIELNVHRPARGRVKSCIVKKKKKKEYLRSLFFTRLPGNLAVRCPTEKLR